MSVVFVGSPNYWSSREGHKIDRIVMHWMAGTLSATDSVFQDTNRQSSAHYGIEDDEIHQYVDEGYAAWHSGDADMNLRSIGIEHSAAPGRDASPITIETSANLVADICKRYAIPCDREHIIKHSQVFNTQCPGTLPIDTIIQRANEILRGEEMTKQQAVSLAQRIGLLAHMSEAEITAKWLEYHAKNIMADPDYAAALAKQLYEGKPWQLASWKAVHYDNDLAEVKKLASGADPDGEKFRKIKELLK